MTSQPGCRSLMTNRSRISKRSCRTWKRCSTELKSPAEVPHEPSGKACQTPGTDCEAETASAAGRGNHTEGEGRAAECDRPGRQGEASARGRCWPGAAAGRRTSPGSPGHFKE